MNKIISVLLFLLFFLSGCENQTTKILDFAGIIFIIFCLIVIVQLSFDKILVWPIFKKINDFTAPLRRFIPAIAYLIGGFVFFAGLFQNGLLKINLFLGLIIGLFGWFMKQYNRKDFNNELRARYAKLITLCITFAVSLYFLMTSSSMYLKL